MHRGGKGKGWEKTGETAFSGCCWCPWQLQGSHRWPPGPGAGQGGSGSHLADPGERQSSRRGRQEKNSGVWKKRKEEEFTRPRAVPFRRDKRLVRNPHPVRCLEHQKDVRASKLQPDWSRGRCNTAPWLGECCLSSRGPLVHLVAKPAQPPQSSLGLLGIGHLGATGFQPHALAYQVLSIILGLHQSTLLFRLSQSFISLSRLLLLMFVPGMSWSSHLLMAAKYAGDSSPILQKLLKLQHRGFSLTPLVSKKMSRMEAHKSKCQH